ncbi:SMP-30/gluconolactonase/LRE family protein [Tautonia sociabilis]|nr:SMP-30/gluconolactonase/LRE family protein [Tautonia sociabilis]
MGQDRIDFAALGPPLALLAPEASVTVDSAVCFLEGPAEDDRGNLYFSDIAGNRILRRAPDGTVSTFREPSGRANGNTFDAQGRLISCEGTEQGLDGGRRVVRTDLSTGAVEVLTDRFNGRRYNSPNDVVVDPSGRVWFTDPYYGEHRAILEQDAEAVYRIDPDGSVCRVLSQPMIERPNGLAISPDGQTLYVVDSHSRPGGNRTIWAFDLDDVGSPSNRRLVVDFGSGRGGDGMRLDLDGHLWVAAGIARPRHGGESDAVPAGVYVFTPDGEPIGRIPIPEDVVTNLAFGGPGRRTLFVTAGRTVYRLPVSVSGYALWPPAR